MSGLYPNILFHFTNRDGLFGILSETFKLSYSREKIVGEHNSTEFGIPIVSFCDLRLSELKSHMDKYGKYGIGMSKKWANSNGLNPVFYVNKSCPSTSKFISAIEQLRDLFAFIYDDKNNDKHSIAYMNIFNMYRFMKNYEGDLTRKTLKGSLITKEYRHANEREWRYVPALSLAIRHFVPLNEIRTPDQKKALNDSISNHRLRFKPEDIEYLIVKRDSERIDLIEHLRSAKQTFDEKTKRRLASRIITSHQINSDM